MVTHPDEFLQSTDQFRQLLSGEISHYITDRRYVRRNGEVFWARVLMSIVRDPNGKPLYLVGLINDIDAETVGRTAGRARRCPSPPARTAHRRAHPRANVANQRLAEKAAQDAVIAERTRLARDVTATW